MRGAWSQQNVFLGGIFPLILYIFLFYFLLLSPVGKEKKLEGAFLVSFWRDRRTERERERERERVSKSESDAFR